MLGNSGSVKTRYFFVYSFPHSFFTLKQGRWQIHYDHESWLMDISQGWAGWKAFAFTGL